MKEKMTEPMIEITPTKMERVNKRMVESTTDESAYHVPSIVPEVRKNWPEELWDIVR